LWNEADRVKKTTVTKGLPLPLRPSHVPQGLAKPASPWKQDGLSHDTVLNILIGFNKRKNNVDNISIYLSVWLLVCFSCTGKGKAVSPVTGLEWPRGFQEFKVPRFHDKGTGLW
jgi:hypothetical protein